MSHRSQNLKLRRKRPQLDREVVQPGEGVGFHTAFLDAAHNRSATSNDRAALDQVRRQWLDRKANAHREPSIDQSTLSHGLSDARAAKLARLQNAYRGQD